MKVTYTRFNQQNKIAFSKAGHLTKKNATKTALVQTILKAYKDMLNNPDCNAVSITLRKEVK